VADFEGLAQAIISGNKDLAESLTIDALNEGTPPDQILNNGLVAGMNIVGQKFKANEFYVPEVLIAARAMNAAMTHLRPALVETGAKPVGKIVLGTVKDDLHDIGKNLVGMMLEGAGFEIIDLGTDVKPEKFTEAVEEYNAQIVALSALLTTTMPAMKATIDVLESAGLRDRVKVMIGGAPVTQNYADEIGADGYAPDAASAVDTAKILIGLTA